MAQPATTVRPDPASPAAGHLGGPAQSDPRVRHTGRIDSHRERPAVTARRLSAASAVLVLVGGFVHLCLYRHGYRFIPKIGVSFVIQAVSSAVLAVALLVKGGRLAQVTRLAAIGLSLGTLAALGLAHTAHGLFQFREIGLRPAPQTLIAVVAESVAALLLGLAMVQGLRAAPRQAATSAAALPSSPARRAA